MKTQDRKNLITKIALELKKYEAQGYKKINEQIALGSDLARQAFLLGHQIGKQEADRFLAPLTKIRA